MRFAGIDYWAVFLAAVAGYLVGALWYWMLRKPWMTAVGVTETTLKGKDQKPSPLPYVLAFVANLVMAWVLAGLVGHLGIGQVTLRNGVISAAFVWFGFVITTLAVNNSFAKRKPVLIAIDGGHWLAVLLLMGAIIGAMGVE
jgi:dipeptide/tripeptide permease